MTPIRTLTASIFASALLLTGCQSAGVHVASEPDETQASAMDLLAQFEGEWEMVDENGETGPGSVFKVTSAGSIVREIMFEGHGHEMTNVYHMDGGQVVCTHYCAVGNQPRMVATVDGSNSLAFKTDSVSNLLPAQEHYMGELTLTLVDDNTLEQEWTTFNMDGEIEHAMTFVMKRRL